MFDYPYTQRFILSNNTPKRTIIETYDPSPIDVDMAYAVSELTNFANITIDRARYDEWGAQTAFAMMYDFFFHDESIYPVASSIPNRIQNEMRKNAKVEQYINDLYRAQRNIGEWGGNIMVSHYRQIINEYDMLVAECCSPYATDPDEIKQYTYFIQTYFNYIEAGRHATLIVLPPKHSLYYKDYAITIMLLYGHVPKNNPLHKYIVPLTNESPLRYI